MDMDMIADGRVCQVIARSIEYSFLVIDRVESHSDIGFGSCEHRTRESYAIYRGVINPHPQNNPPVIVVPW